MWGTNPDWTVSSPWTEASTRGATFQKSWSEYDPTHPVSLCRCGEISGELMIFLSVFFFVFFQNLYESIKNEPFKIPEDDGNDLTHTFFNPDREGWLLKLGEMMPARPLVLRFAAFCVAFNTDRVQSFTDKMQYVFQMSGVFIATAIRKWFLLSSAVFCSPSRLRAMMKLSFCLWGFQPLCLHLNYRLTSLWHWNTGTDRETHFLVLWQPSDPIVFFCMAGPVISVSLIRSSLPLPCLRLSSASL